MKDDYSAIGVLQGLRIYSEVQSAKKLSLDALKVLECLAAYNSARCLVSYTEYQVSTTFVRDGNTIPGQPVAVETLFCFLELDVLVFASRHPFIELL